MKTVFATAWVLSLGLFLTACSSDEGAKQAKGANSPASKIIRITGYIAIPDSTTGTYTADGELVAKEQVNLQSETSGRLVKLYAKDGQKVLKGALLAKIDDSELQANLKSARATLELSQKKAARTKTLYEKDGATAEELESAESAVESATAAKELIEAQLKKTEIRAPFSGTLGVVEVSEGAHMVSGTSIATLTNTSELNVEFELPQRYSQNVKVGDKVVLVDTERSVQAEATVRFMDATMSKTSRTRKVRAVVPNKDGKYLPGTYVRVKLNFGKGDEVGMPVPTEAVTLDADGAYVFVVKGGAAKKVYIRTGLRTPVTVDVVKGLSAGDTVVSSGLMRVRDGALVEIKDIQNNMSYGVNE